MDYLLDYMPVVGDIIRTTKYSYKLGKIIGDFFSQQNEPESDFTVVWRRTDVFVKMEKEKRNEMGENLFILLLLPLLLGLIFGSIFEIISDGDVPMIGMFFLSMALGYPLLFPKVIIPYLRMRRIENTSEIELTNSPYKLVRSKEGKIGICYWESYGRAKLILNPIYDKIELGLNGSYVVKDKDKYMLYNAHLKVFVAENCDYIIKYKEGIYLFIMGDELFLMTPMGDRIYE